MKIDNNNLFIHSVLVIRLKWLTIPVVLIMLTTSLMVQVSPVAEARPLTASIIVPSWPPAPDKFEKDGNTTYVTVTLGIHAEDPGGLMEISLYCSQSQPINISTGQVDYNEKNASRIRVENTWVRTPINDSHARNLRKETFTLPFCNCVHEHAGETGWAACGMWCSQDWEFYIPVYGDFYVDKRICYDDLMDASRGFRYFFAFGSYQEICATVPQLPGSILTARLDRMNATAQELAAAAMLPPNGVPVEESILTHVPIESMKTNETANLTATVKSKPPVNAALFYTNSCETAFNQVAMVVIDTSGDITTYKGTIPAQKKTGALRYYIKANNATKTETSPPNAPTAYHKVAVGEDLRIVSSYPRHGDVNVPTDLTTTVKPAATIVFSEDLYTGYVSDKTFKMFYLDNIGYRYDIPCTVDYYSKNFTVQMTPAQILPDGTHVNISISSLVCNRGVKSTLGTDRIISFTTLPKVTVTMQAIQVSENVDLIEQKPAVVRVFAAWPALQEGAVKKLGASVVLSVDGVQVSSMARKDYQPSRYLKGAAIWRGDLSANFYNPNFVNYPGKHTLSVTVTPLGQHTAKQESYTCETSVNVRQLCVSMRTRSWQYETFYAPLGVGNYKTLYWASLPVNIIPLATAQNGYVGDVLPVGRAVPTIQTSVVPEPLMASGFTAAGGTDADYYFGTLFFALHKAALFDTYSREVYIVPQDWLTSKYGAKGLSNSNFWRVTLIETGSLDPITVHELLHTYGYDDHDESIKDIEGFDVRGHRVKSGTEYPSDLANLMQEIPTTGDMSWISTTQYQGMMNRFTVAHGRASGEDKSLLISGYAGNGATFFPLYELNTPPDYSGLVPGNITIVLRDAANNTLATYNVTPCKVGDREYFAFSAARPTGLTSVVMVNRTTGAEIVRMVRSVNAPKVTISGPTGSVSGPFEVRWNGSDADGDNMTYSILTSSDGVNWKALLTDTNGTNFTITPSGLNGKSLYVRVMVSDGFNTASADLPALSMANRQPTVEVTAPDAADLAQGYEVGDSIPLSASAYDQEDGLLDGASVVWKSNIQGELGKGASFATVLSFGTHRVTVTTTDSGGLAVNVSVNITVRDETGAAPAPQETYWVVATASDSYTTTGQIGLSWFGKFPEKGSIAIYKKGTSYWQKLGSFEGFARANCTVTGLSTNQSIDYQFAVGILDENGNRLNLSEPVMVSTYANTTPPPTPPKPPKPPEPGFIPVSPFAAPAAIAMAMALLSILRKSDPRRSKRDNR